MKRTIHKVAVLGSGVMGSRIACHFANIGVQALLLDITPKELNEEEKQKKLSLSDRAVRNRIVNNALSEALKSKPASLYKSDFAARIQTGNMDDDLALLSECDWIIEAVTERLDIKKIVFEKVEAHRKPGSIVSSNTSGIPMQMLLEGRSPDFRACFLGTHFFNPPRYLRLLELIPTPDTHPDIVQFADDFGKRFLGKTTVLCKDTPAFIANRIGVFSIQALFHLVTDMKLRVEEVDKLTGSVLGRPKSATFRTCDVVGLDTLAHVAKGLYEHCPNDEARPLFAPPAFVTGMLEQNKLGSKTKEGFYKKVKNADGSSDIHALNLNTLTYEAQQKVSFPTLDAARQVDYLPDRLKVLVNGKDKAGEFYRKSFYGLFAYVSNRIPEIADEPYKIDDAMRAGFAWQLGPFEMWDALHLPDTLKQMEEAGFKAAAWVHEMVQQGNTSFYKIENGKKYFFHPEKKAYTGIPGNENLLILSNRNYEHVIWKNAGSSITDLGDGILNLAFHSKMNSMGSEVIKGINKAIDLAEQDYAGLVIYNEGENFSAGANVALIFMLAAEQEYEELDMAVRVFQQTIMRVRYSNIPVVAAPHNLTLGGSCELCMHADKVVAHAETYMGLVEFGVGVIPGGGGTKEFALRLSDEIQEGDVRINAFRKRFLTIGQAQVATSAYEAFDLGYLRKGQDEVIVDRASQLTHAKKSALLMAEKGYTRPIQRNDINVLGKEGLGIVYVGADSMKSGNYISEHDKLISEKLGWVLCGGDLSQPTRVSEQYLLDMERKAFLELCAERKTLERLQSILTSGKILRN